MHRLIARGVSGSYSRGLMSTGEVRHLLASHWREGGSDIGMVWEAQILTSEIEHSEVHCDG
jgi:hypothetical protein